ncbi:MAG: hypothetical protein LBE18_07985 [Planctomycetaceae bacterium]|jgi:RNA binding exosome subunit|nr:hypothetical protein [Planctomycetaceae bacterium]
MTKRLLVSCWTILAALTFYCVHVSHVSGENPVIISYQDNFKIFASSDFAKRLLKLPEWNSYVETFTKACDKKIEQELSADKLNQILPSEVVKDLRQFLESEISTRHIAEAAFQHLEMIIFELQADFDRKEIDENLQDITDILKGRKKDLEIDFDGVLAFIVDINPRSALSFLKYFRKDTDYKFIQNEPNGDFILKFDFDFNGRDIEFCCAGIKLAADRYAFIFADDDQIKQYCKAFKTGRYAKLKSTKQKKELILKETCFLFLERQLKNANVDSAEKGTEFLSKIKQVKLEFHEDKSIPQVEINATMHTTEDSTAVRDMLNVLITVAQLQTSENSTERNLLKAVKVDTNGVNVFVKINLDNPDLWKIIAKGLKQATNKIKERNESIN